ncbi:MAG: DUF4149 domain-containing protein [Thiobacillus sp.]
MNKNSFWSGVSGLILVIWLGSLFTLGTIAAPILFNALENKQLAGMLAGKMFAVGAWVGLVAGAYLLLYSLKRDGAHAFKTWFFWLVLIMWLLTLAGHFGVQPILQNLKNQALPLAVMQSVFADRFSQWHGISRILWVIQAVLGVILVWRSGLAK